MRRSQPSGREHSPYFPFIDRDEWELGKFLYTHFTQVQIDDFLKLRWVTRGSPTSFHSAKELLSQLDAIPKGPTWHCTKIHTEGYITKEPVYLYWRDALEVVRDIFGNPVFAKHMEYDPYQIFEGMDREYGEWMSGDEAYRIQDQLPEGATIIPVVLASDKAPVTRMTGDIKMHPLFLTIANINSEVRMKVTSHAWSCIAYTPSPEFIAHSEFRSVLEARVWHRCVDIVCAGLKLAARTGTFMSDPSSVTRYCFTPLAAYIADLPEQLMIACLHALCQDTDPWNLSNFLPKAKMQHLSGVQLPFWRDWASSDPCVFLVGELLHSGHKFFFDHPFKWCRELLGHDELDMRYCTQHKRVGTRHFNGVSHISQMTGREHRDLQRTIVATIAGLADPDFTCAIRAIIDFLYRAQSPTFTTSSINAMGESLAEFHAHKDSILEMGVRRGKSGKIDHFRIPKIELLQSFGRNIRDVGSLIQYTADVSERLLITHCKDPFTRTNRQRTSFTKQIVLLLDHEESIRQFDLYSLLSERGINLTNTPCVESNVPQYIDPTLEWVQRVAPEEVNSFHGPRVFRNHFLKGILSEDSTTTFHVTVQTDFADKTSNYLVDTYNLPDFPVLLRAYIDAFPGNHSRLHGRLLKGWRKFRLQLQSRLYPRNLLPSQQVQALPPSTEHPLGKCDAVLVHHRPSSGIPTIVAQVRTVFAFSSRGSALPTGLSDPLLYVQYFTFTATPSDQPDVGMYAVERMFVNNPEDGTRSRVGAIISLLDVIHAVELIPKYGTVANRGVTSETCLELYDRFYLNNFTDTEWYYTMYQDYQ
ncbi:hypothetical protein M404DRAFT_138348 [Pisolithus tinctorius Marx 270]|uniref:DUF6830 domain-containing protein n=1 Tax=Pisolithus tinctorius Marx 270 TaxID=870435 RepID=A0A0C3PFC7_PISTI|nr:hypothetical protein M404DRAFT_138348 [Pisolithus tinctorius Marx 270]